MTAVHLSSHANAVVPAALFHTHRGGAHAVKPDALTEAGAGQAGLLPVGAGQTLLANLVQSLQQTVNASAVAGQAGGTGAASGTSSAGTVAGASGAATTSGTAQDLQAFLHALFQALRAEGTTGTTSAAAGPTPGAGAPATAQLTASYQQLQQDLGGAGNSASLQGFLNSFLQNIRSAGAGAPSPLGNNVNSLA